ncbi:hypothetical protein [Bacillus thuringiensis]|uniref:hypothetical protein n=1 Tax=Bacillus thuringiensis TaxID=1428 RepID=UPI00197AA84B|nr:hypothetical protein [Bacillus thuringiensis]MEC3270759.1 hypothetical protein [Bacillus thuringiensis]
MEMVRARDLGMSVEEYRTMLREKDKQRKADEEHYLNSELYVLDMKKKKDN